MTIAEKHIRHYNHLNGKEITKKQLVRIHAALNNDLEKKRIDIHGPLGAECVTIRERIDRAIKLMNGKPMRITLKTIPVDNILRVAQLKQTETKRTWKKSNAQTVKASAESQPAPHRVASASDVTAKEKSKRLEPGSENLKGPQNGVKKKINLSDGPYKDFVKLYEDTQIMYYAMPGSGKTFDLLKFLKYLADKGYPVAFVAAEEYGRSTLDEKIQDIFRQPSLAAFKYKNYQIVESVADIQNLPQVKVIVFDSVDKLKWTVDDWTAFSKAHRNVIKIAVKQTTKEGDFKGGNDWAHEMDIVVEMRNRRRIFHKNRLDPDFGRKRDKLLMEDRIRRKTENMQINGIVKQRTAPVTRPVIDFKPDTVV